MLENLGQNVTYQHIITLQLLTNIHNIIMVVSFLIKQFNVHLDCMKIIFFSKEGILRIISYPRKANCVFYFIQARHIAYLCDLYCILRICVIASRVVFWQRLRGSVGKCSVAQLLFFPIIPTILILPYYSYNPDSCNGQLFSCACIFVLYLFLCIFALFILYFVVFLVP